MSPAEYVRAIERHVCQKNDGHIIRVVGPAFDIVSGWEREGVPLKIALQGIDRCFERYYRGRNPVGGAGGVRLAPRRRPVRVEFCDADVLDVFDEWRRAVGITRRTLDERADDGARADAGRPSDPPPDNSSDRPSGRGPSLPAHLERVLIKLSSARATGRIGSEMDRVIDRVSHELDTARTEARGLRGEARRALIERLATLDRELVDAAAAALTAAARDGLEVEADRELAAFRARLAPDAYHRAHQAVVDRLVREQALLPVITFA